MAWKGIVAQSFTPEGFDLYCHGLKWQAWRPSFITLHNTYLPSLAMRPDGFTIQHMRNLETFFKGKGWSAAPHLFIDDKQIWVFTPLTVSGVHSPSWNKLSIGIEMLGDFEKEPFVTGRGALVRSNTVAAIATLSAVLGIDPGTMKLHKEDPKTSHKTCPGKHVNKALVIASVRELLSERHRGEHSIEGIGKAIGEAGAKALD